MSDTHHVHDHDPTDHHDHDHSHDPDHGHTHDLRVDLDPALSDEDLRPAALSRRRFLQSAGLLGLTAGASTVLVGGRAAAQAAPAANSNTGTYTWLAGDHHIHTQYSPDAQYTVAQHAAQAKRNGIDWMVITDHGSVAHEKVSIARTNTDVVRARGDFPGMLVYQGVEWNIPGAEHGTVFFPPTALETLMLDLFEGTWDGAIINPANPKEDSPFMERKAVDAIRWLSAQVALKRVPAALFLANHPSRRGVDSPHEIRAWNDAGPTVAVGFEGAPGHQAGGVAKAALGPELGRGFYDNTPSIDSFTGYPLESYRTFGGFDWMTARVGGLWDSLLAEGRRWWITVNSDSHAIYKDTLKRGLGDGKYNDPTSPFYGAYGDPVDTGIQIAGNGDYWPGFYGRTVVGSTGREYVAVMKAIGEGRMWVVHGDLIKALDVRVTGTTMANGGATLGGTYMARVGDDVTITIKVTLNSTANNNGSIPALKRVDVISGPITGRTRDRDSFSAPETAVVRSFDVNQASGEVTLTHTFKDVKRPFFVRLRGTDARVSAPGSIEPRLDPVPVDPWTDLWFYANPTFIELAP